MTIQHLSAWCCPQTRRHGRQSMSPHRSGPWTDRRTSRTLHPSDIPSSSELFCTTTIYHGRLESPIMCKIWKTFFFHRCCDHLIQEFKDKLTKPQAKWIERGSQSKCLEVSLVEHRLQTWYWYPKTNGAGSGGFMVFVFSCVDMCLSMFLQFQKFHSFRNSHTSICGLTFLNRNILYWDDQELQSQTRICVHAHLSQILMNLLYNQFSTFFLSTFQHFYQLSALGVLFCQCP